MSLPTLAKTWQFNVNQKTTTSSVLLTDCQNTLYKIKTTLTGFTNPWTVVASSDGSTAGASDKWTASNKLIWAASSNARSWIVLQQTGMSGGTYQLYIDCTNASPQNLYVACSVGGLYTGFTTPASKPTATDEIVLLNTSTWFNTVASTSVLHIMMTSDGYSTRIFNYIGSTNYSSFFIETLASDSALTYKIASAVKTSNTYATFYGSSVTPWSSRYSSTNFVAYTGVESYYNSTVPAANSGAVSDFTTAYPICPLSIHSEAAGAKGRVGSLVDLWFGSTAVAVGSTYPSSGGKTFIQLGGFVLPWNGSVPVLA